MGATTANPTIVQSVLPIIASNVASAPHLPLSGAVSTATPANQSFSRKCFFSTIHSFFTFFHFLLFRIFCSSSFWSFSWLQFSSTFCSSSTPGLVYSNSSCNFSSDRLLVKMVRRRREKARKSIKANQQTAISHSLTALIYFLSPLSTDNSHFSPFSDNDHQPGERHTIKVEVVSSHTRVMATIDGTIVSIIST